MQDSIKVWDIAIRIFHWSLVTFFAVAYLSGEAEAETLHAWAGYVIIALLTFRLIWGFVGTKYARFSDFIYSPGDIVTYLKNLLTTHPKHYFGHNPAGGLMVVIMLLMLIAASWTGLMAYGVEGKGPLASIDTSISTSIIPVAQADDDDEYGEHEGGESVWEEVHEVTVNLMLLLVIIHLGGVAVSSLLHRENLVRAMITGRKPKPNE